jgi:alpha-mannosidase
MAITAEKIEQLVARKGVRRIAVANFLSTLNGMSQADALANLQMDARLYKWDAGTVDAIREGIEAHFAA